MNAVFFLLLFCYVSPCDDLTMNLVFKSLHCFGEIVLKADTHETIHLSKEFGTQVNIVEIINMVIFVIDLKYLQVTFSLKTPSVKVL